MKIAWTALFCVSSAVCAGVAAGSWSAGGAVFFGLWCISGIIELSR